MSGNRVLLDTNIAIFYLQGDIRCEKYFLEFHPLFCFISELELLSGGGFNDDELSLLKVFMSKQLVLDYIPAIKESIINIRKQKKLKLPDAIIAATAMYLDIPLVSADKTFLNIEGLKFIYNEPAIS